MPDLFIPCAPKDYIKLPFVLASVDRFLPDIEAAHITTREPIAPIGVFRFPVYYHLDRDVLPFDYTRFQFRPTWIYQQFLKLFQRVTADWYLVMDADRFINTPLDLFDGTRPVMFLRDRDENHGPYFEYSQKMISVGKIFERSFLSECTLYNRRYIDEMLAAAACTVETWLDESARVITATCCPADAELYGSFMQANHPGLYRYRLLRDYMRGKYGDQGEWTAGEIAAYVDEMAARDDVDFFTAHSWHD